MKFLVSNANVLAILTAALFILGPLLAHFHILPAIAGFGLFALSILLGVVCLIGSVSAVKSKKIQTGVMLLSVGLLPVILVSYSMATGGSHPPINDVTTDITNPPILFDQRNPTVPVELSAETAAVIKEQYSDVVSLRSTRAPELVFAIISDEVKKNKEWTIVKFDEEALAVHGYEQFGIFQFTDDFTIRVTPDDAGGSVIDMRSKSRNGKSDLGANARRIRAFMTGLSTKL